MKIFTKRTTLVTAMLLATAALAGCGNLSHNIAKDGKSAGQLVWPTVNSTNPMRDNGTAPTLASVREIHAGMTKNQVAALIGYPHFNEGVFGVREWDYVLNFYKPGSDTPTVCQYKVLFNEHKLAESFYWKPESCADLVKGEAKPEAKPEAKEAPAKDEHYTLSADALFPFAKGAIGDIKPEGRHELDELARKIDAHGKDIGSVHVVGYTDRIGSDTYNDELSRKRADSVMTYLTQHGVSSKTITAEGRGSAAPVTTDCHQTKRAALIACLQPDRRVEVIVHGKK